jgi:hypothetical protein
MVVSIHSGTVSRHTKTRGGGSLSRLAKIACAVDVGVVERCGEGDLAEEAFGAEGVGQLGFQDFEGDGAVELVVAGAVDRSHAPAAELALDRVPVRQRRAEPREDVGLGVHAACPSMRFAGRSGQGTSVLRPRSPTATRLDRVTSPAGESA